MCRDIDCMCYDDHKECQAEIDRFKRELEEAKALIAQSTLDLSVEYQQRKSLERQLAEAKQDISKYTLMFAERDNEAFGLERQLDASQALLAEARAEVERQQKEIIALRKSVIELERCSSDEAPGLIKQQARQEAAKECYNLVNTFATLDIVFVLDAIKAKFGLEG